MKMEITMNEFKIAEDSIYRPSDIYSELDKLFDQQQARKLSQGIYDVIGANAWEKCGVIILILKRQEWFMPYFEKWLWESKPGIFENVADHYRKKYK